MILLLLAVYTLICIAVCIYGIFQYDKGYKQGYEDAQKK